MGSRMEPTIYKPSIYKGAGIYKLGGGGGGGGGDAVCAINNWTSSDKQNYYDILIDANNCCTFEIAFLPSSNQGSVCSFWSSSVSSKPVIALNAFNPIIDIFDGENSRYDGYPPDLGVINKVKIYRDINIYGYRSQVTNTQTNVTRTASMSWANKDNLIQTLRIYQGRQNTNSSRNCLIFYIKITSGDGDVIYNFVPDEQNGVAGFTDTISGNFYGSPYNDNSIYAVKKIEP